MKNCLLLCLFFITVFVYPSTAQMGSPTARVKGTLVQTGTNSVMVKLRPNETFGGQLSNFQFTIQVPNTVSPQPTVSIKSNPLNTFIPTPNYLFENSDEGGYYNYLFAVTTVGSPVFNLTNGVEFDALELQFSGGVGISQVRLAQLPNGGISTQKNFYIEISGNDNTDVAAMFYGAGATNTGSYSSYSFVPVNNIALPVKFSDFTANKSNNDGLLTWVVENETSNINKYEIERSVDGYSFEKITTVSPKNNGKQSNVYTITDASVGITKSNTTLYYRVKQIDIDGKFVYTDVKTLRFDVKLKAISVFPNPVINNYTTLRVEANKNTTATITILNADGKQISVNNMALTQGVNVKNIDLKAVAKGNYLINVLIDNELQSIKVIKQ